MTIRSKILIFSSSLAFCIVVALFGVGVFLVKEISQSSKQISSEALRSQALEYLESAVKDNTEINQLKLELVKNISEEHALTLSKLYERADFLLAKSDWNFASATTRNEGGQLMNLEVEEASLYAPHFVEITDEIKKELELGYFLDFLIPGSMNLNPNIAAIFYGSKLKTTRYYPDVRLGDVVPLDFDATKRPWYVSANPENNPERKMVWSEVYEDATGQGLLVTAATPVYVGDEFKGVVGIDVVLDDIAEELRDYSLFETGYFFLLDKDKNVVVMSADEQENFFETYSEDKKMNISDAKKQVRSLVEGFDGQFEIYDEVRLHGENHFFGLAKMKNTDWILGGVVHESEIISPLNDIKTSINQLFNQVIFGLITPLLIGLLLLVLLVNAFVARNITKPLESLVAGTKQIAKGKWDIQNIEEKTSSEISGLAKSFNAMRQSLIDYKRKKEEVEKSLEEQVEERTQELNVRNKELEKTLDDFYTVRMGMLDDIEKGELKKENEKIKKRLDDLRNKEV